MTLWIPRSAVSAEQSNFKCLTCDADGVDTEHVISCSKDNVDLEQRLSPSNNKSIWNGKPVDVDLEGWVDRHRKALLEGRKKI